MSLVYRGCRYTSPAQSAQSCSGELDGRYRGLPWHRSAASTVPQRSAKELCYRSIPYRINANGQIMPSDRSQRRRTSPSWAIAARKSSAKMTDEVAVRHHDALLSRLDARMAIARSQGNTELLRTLESERQQLA
ncbi:MAG: DUF4278 domain-containing protein [Cyanobacteria bacterium P01_D01_bin.73]